VRTAADEKWDRVWVGANIASMVAGGEPYGKLQSDALAVAGGRIAWIGPSAEAQSRAAAQSVPVVDCRGLWILPGLIDCHTHLVYGGNRVEEFEQRLGGASYAEISRAGGGIQSTVNATRAAGAAELRAAAAVRAQRLMAEGVTTIEVKSGYGLDLPTERRMLEVARSLERELPVSIQTTYLALHALPREFHDRRGEFVALACGPWLESLAAAGLVDAVDVFCETIAFSIEEGERLLRAAAKLNLPAHLHVGQLSDLGGAQLAAAHGALSADHLEYVGAEGARALADAGTVAVLLPAAYYTLRQSVPPPVGLLREAGVGMAVASDCNPGSSPCTSLLLALNMACTLFGLTPAEALAGVTRQAARALGLGGEIGTLEAGKRADFALFDIARPAELCYALGANPCVGVVHRGTLRG
jgi:imidazolonepropionase